MIDTLRALLVPGKGLLAMDESVGTCNQRLAAAGIAATAEMRQAWRALLLGTPQLGEGISGVILHDETLRQSLDNGRSMVSTVQMAQDAGLQIGIKVDLGTQDLPGHAGEKVTEGLDGLGPRLQAYRTLGARFAKWRSVCSIGDLAARPSLACIEANAHALARYAGLCQAAGLVPIVEPEVLMAGPHSLAHCQQVTEALLGSVFNQLQRQGVALEWLILKPNMVISGLECPQQSSPAEVARATLQCLRRVVPAAVPGVVFLSGGQSGPQASSRLNALHALPDATLPWVLSFSFARALQHPALDIWAGQASQQGAARAALMHRVRCNVAALRGRYTPELEHP
jgi:fructose-bisphosphate aldolase, class I